MPNIIGEFTAVSTTIAPLDAHLGHLRHLTNQRIARDILRERHRLTATQARETAKLVGSHVGQALNFHEESRSAIPAIRPVLQYYSYLNLAVGAILAFRPPNHNQYRRHGVEDKTHSLNKLDLGSVVLVANRGAVPLFHMILSDVPLDNRRFRFGQLAAGFHMFAHELATRFNKKMRNIVVTDEVRQDGNDWKSVFSYSELANGIRTRVTPKRLEAAMPLLASDYARDISNADRTVYTSTDSWITENAAQVVHRQNGIKLVNYGGHLVHSTITGTESVYLWRGVSRTPLMPTLSSTLLLAFSLASIVRYRPILLDVAMSSPTALLIDTFVAEADTVFIPALRNLLYREEVAVGSSDYV